MTQCFSDRIPKLAYIDAGTGAIVFQALVGLVLGGLFTLKMYWRRVKSAVQRWLGRTPDQEKPHDR